MEEDKNRTMRSPKQYFFRDWCIKWYQGALKSTKWRPNSSESPLVTQDCPKEQEAPSQKKATWTGLDVSASAVDNEELAAMAGRHGTDHSTAVSPSGSQDLPENPLHWGWCRVDQDSDEHHLLLCVGKPRRWENQTLVHWLFQRWGTLHSPTRLPYVSSGRKEHWMKLFFLSKVELVQIL